MMLRYFLLHVRVFRMLINIFRKEQALSMYSKRRKSILRPVIEAQKKLNQHSSGAASSGKSRAKRTSAEPVTRLVQ